MEELVRVERVGNKSKKTKIRFLHFLWSEQNHSWAPQLKNN